MSELRDQSIPRIHSMIPTPRQPTALNLQPPGLVQSRRAVGRADRAGGRADRRGTDARRRRRPDRPVADRADVAFRPVRNSRRHARRPLLAAMADDCRGGAARDRPVRNAAADLARLADAAAARAARLRRRLRNRGLQRGRTRTGALFGIAETSPRRQCADRTRAHRCICGGPALGGVLVGWVGAAPAFGFAAALSIVAVVLLSGIYEPVRAPAPRRHPMQEIREGAAFVLHHPLLRPVFITQFIFNTASFAIARGVRALCGAAFRTVGLRHRHDIGDVRRRHGGRCVAGDAGDAAVAIRHRDRPWDR